MQAGNSHETRDITMAWNMSAKLFSLNPVCFNYRDVDCWLQASTIRHDDGHDLRLL